MSFALNQRMKLNLYLQNLRDSVYSRLAKIPHQVIDAHFTSRCTKCICNDLRFTYIFQISDGNVDVNRTLEYLVSSQNIQSDVSGSMDSIDPIIRLTADVFRLCIIEKTAISIRFENILSPELSSTIIWFLFRWSKSYLVPYETYYSEISTMILQAFGESSPGASWTMNFLVEKIICNIEAFKSEPSLIKGTVELLVALTGTRKK